MDSGLIPMDKIRGLSAKIANLTEDAKKLQGFFANIRSQRTRDEYEHTIKGEITIDASASVVWKILTDFQSYPKWNSSCWK